MLDLNSGGGSPVQAEMVYEYIMSLRDKGKPVKAIVQEGCMSACYYIASAAESITAHRSSVVLVAAFESFIVLTPMVLALHVRRKR